MIVSEVCPWLSTSPDGILYDFEIVEMKCPNFSKLWTSLEQFFTRKSGFFCFEGVEEASASF